MACREQVGLCATNYTYLANLAAKARAGGVSCWIVRTRKLKVSMDADTCTSIHGCILPKSCQSMLQCTPLSWPPDTCRMLGRQSGKRKRRERRGGGGGGEKEKERRRHYYSTFQSGLLVRVLGVPSHSPELRFPPRVLCASKIAGSGERLMSWGWGFLRRRYLHCPIPK